MSVCEIVFIYMNMFALLLLLQWLNLPAQIAILLPIEMTTQRGECHLLQQVSNYLIKRNEKRSKTRRERDREA